MKTISVMLEDELYNVIKQRAKFNHRSLSSEVNYLVECGLAEKSEITREFMRLIFQINKGGENEGND